MNETISISKIFGCCKKKDDICEDKIREKAYYLWELAGRPEGDGLQFWHEAKELLKEGK